MLGLPIGYRRNIPRRKSHLSLNLEKIPPSPTIQNYNFELNPPNTKTKISLKPKMSTIFSKIIQRWLMGEAWHESLNHLHSLSTNPSNSTNSSSSDNSAALENEIMLPKTVEN